MARIKNNRGKAIVIVQMIICVVRAGLRRFRGSRLLTGSPSSASNSSCFSETSTFSLGLPFAGADVYGGGAAGVALFFADRFNQAGSAPATPRVAVRSPGHVRAGRPRAIFIACSPSFKTL
jgi:hypothetical protein